MSYIWLISTLPLLIFLHTRKWTIECILLLTGFLQSQILRKTLGSQNIWKTRAGGRVKEVWKGKATFVYIAFLVGIIYDWTNLPPEHCFVCLLNFMPWDSSKVSWNYFLSFGFFSSLPFLSPHSPFFSYSFLLLFFPFFCLLLHSFHLLLLLAYLQWLPVYFSKEYLRAGKSRCVQQVIEMVNEERIVS